MMVMELILCRVVGMTFHVIGPRRDTSDFPGMVIFSVVPAENSGFKHGSVIVNNIFAYFTLSLSTPQVYMIKERCWFSQNQLLC